MINQLLASVIVAAAAFWGTYQLFPRLFPTPRPEVAQIGLADAILSLKKELVEVSAAPGATAGLSLTTAKIELTTQRDTKQGSSGALTIPVFDAATFDLEQSVKLGGGSKIVTVLAAPKGTELLSKDVGGPDLDLSSLVLAAREALLSSMSADPPLMPKSVEISINFALVRSSAAGAQIKAKVLELGQTNSSSDSWGNSVVLTYVNPALASEGAAVPPR